MKDVFGVDLQLGDQVAFITPRYRGLTVGVIIDFTPKQVRIETNVLDWRNKLKTSLCYPHDVAKRYIPPPIDLAMPLDDGGPWRGQIAA